MKLLPDEATWDTCVAPAGRRRKKRNNANDNNNDGSLRSGYTYVAAELQVQCWSPSGSAADLQGSVEYGYNSPYGYGFAK